MTDVINLARLYFVAHCMVSGLYALVGLMFSAVLAGYWMALTSGQAGPDWRAVPVVVLAGFAFFFAYRVWPKR